MRHGFSCAFLALMVCVGCSGGGGSQTMLPATTDGAARLSPQSVSTGPAMLQINAGGPATGSFAADEFFAGYSAARTDTTPINSGTDTVPPAIYSTYRTAPKSLTYSISGLAPYGAYTGALYFEEPLLGGVGRRVMNVSVGGVSVVTGLDIFAKTGATHKPYTLPITGTATVNGTLDIVLTATVNDTILSGISLRAVYDADPDASIVTANSGGPATAGFSADHGFQGYSGTNADYNPIDVSGPNVAPAAIFASYRTSPKTIFYSFASLEPGATYSGSLFFEEPLLGGVGRRLMTISTDWGLIAQDFDIYKAAGNKTHTAVALPISSLADGTGAIDIFITPTVNDAIISGISMHVSATAPPTPTRPDE
jgi:hypothetical protein